jgi:tRNA(Ile)-lysidine synthase
MDLLRRVRQFIQERNLLTPGEGVILGVSGGPDSLCLLDLLYALRDNLTLALHVAHLNHGLRPEAAVEAEFVRAEAEKRGLPFHTETADVRAHARAHKQSIEEAARHLRYAFLVRAAHSVGAQKIAVAHTADDQAETVLMHFLRGSGLPGLRGMLPAVEIGGWKLEVGEGALQPPAAVQASKLQIVRPLLAASRAEVEAYCAAHDLHPVQDATNLDATFFRNRLRHELLPQLETYNPNLRAVLRRTAEVAAGDYEILRGLVRERWAQAARVEAGRVLFDRTGWLALSAPEQRALLREAVAHFRPGLRDIDFIPLERAVQFSRRAGPGRSCDVLGGLRLSVTREQVILHAWDEAQPPPPSDIPLVLADGRLAPGWKFQTRTLGPGEWSLDEIERSPSRWQVFVDAARVGPPLRVRARQPGDRFCPFGLGGHHIRLSDFMINAKIDSALRDRWPLVVCGDEVVWVAGLRLDDHFKVKAETRAVLRLGFVKE